MKEITLGPGEIIYSTKDNVFIILKFEINRIKDFFILQKEMLKFI
jgi:hypothetical protein